MHSFLGSHKTYAQWVQQNHLGKQNKANYRMLSLYEFLLPIDLQSIYIVKIHTLLINLNLTPREGTTIRVHAWIFNTGCWRSITTRVCTVYVLDSLAFQFFSNCLNSTFPRPISSAKIPPRYAFSMNIILLTPSTWWGRNFTFSLKEACTVSCYQ